MTLSPYSPLCCQWDQGGKRTLIRIGTVVVAAAVGMLGAAPPANADESLYLNQIRQKNKLFTDLTNDQLIRLGYVACRTMQDSTSAGIPLPSARSRSDQAVASAATEGLGLPSIDRASVMHITQDAEDYLC